MTSYFQYTPSTYTPSMPSPTGRLDTTFNGGVGSIDYGRIPDKPMGEWPISNCKMTPPPSLQEGGGMALSFSRKERATGGRRRSKRHGKRHSKKTKRSRKHNKSRKASRK